jgi:hypothetical protein
MPKKPSEKKSTLDKTEAFVREALSKTSKKRPSERVVRSVAKKVAKALPQHIAHV